MKTLKRTVWFAQPMLLVGLFFLAALAHGQSLALTVSLYSPTNSQIFGAPATLHVYARTVDSNLIQTVQFFANGTSVGQVTNSSSSSATNGSSTNLFSIAWTNVAAATYALTAVAHDHAGNQATSAPVSITVTNPIVLPGVYIYSPTNGARFVAPANLTIYARGYEATGTVATVQFYENNVSLGVVSNSSVTVYTNISSEPLFALGWSNVLTGSYALKAVATDLNGNSATSAVVTITVITNGPPPPPIPYWVSFWYPTNGEAFLAPATIGVHALVTDSNVVRTLQYFANGGSIGIVSNSSSVLLTNSTQDSPFYMAWSNVLAGSYTLSAVATDSAGNMATSAPVNITVTNPPPPVIRPSVGIYSPANGAAYVAPAAVTIYVRAAESTGTIATVQFLANNASLGVVSNNAQMVYPAISSEPLFALAWSNVLTGSYALKAVATDINGNSATSAVVSISVITNSPPPPPPPVPYVVSFWYPTNGEAFLASATIGVHALVTDSNVVRTLQYFANGGSLGIVSNSSSVLLTNSTQDSPFYMAWSNVLAGSYTLSAVATDSAGNMATSAPVNITVTNPPPVIVPFTVSFWYPTNGQIFLAPATVGVHARVTDSNVVRTVHYFANGDSLGSVSNGGNVLLTNSTEGNPFFLAWSNVTAGSFALTAVATDDTGSITSAPVNILVVTSLPPAISIYAPDPVAIEGTNTTHWYLPSTAATNYISGTNTATFLVHRDSATNTDLTVDYSIGGTAINGVDYQTLPGSVTLPAGKSYALITIAPLLDTNAMYGHYDTVTLWLLAPPMAVNVPPPYGVGSPSEAGAIILDEYYLPMMQPVIHSLADNSLQVSLPATNGMNSCLEVSTDMVNWVPVCTNTVLKGSSQFVDPNGTASPGLYYRIVPVANPATY